MHHNKTFGIEFGNPDFVKYAESFGAKGYRVKKAEDFLLKMKLSITDLKNEQIENLVDLKES